MTAITPENAMIVLSDVGFVAIIIISIITIIEAINSKEREKKREDFTKTASLFGSVVVGYIIEYLLALWIFG